MALFKDIARLKAYYPTINKNSSIDTMLPFLTIAEQKYIVPLLGEAQYNSLHSTYQAAANEAALPAAERDLLDKARWPLAYYAAATAMPNLLTMVSDMGVTEQQATGGNATPSREWVLRFQLGETYRSADTFADALLAWLEANKATYPLWANSPARTQHTQLFVASTEQLELFVMVNGSRRAYLALVPFLKQIEEDYLLGLLGESFLLELRTALLGTPTTNQAKAIEKLRRGVATLAVGLALPRMAATITTAGYLYANTGEMPFTADEAKRQQQIATDYISRGQGYLATAKKWLDDNASLFPTYQASLAVGNGEAPYRLPNNQSRNSFMI